MKKRVILIGIGLLIQIIQLVKTNAKTLAKNNLLNIVRSLTSLTPTELIKNFDKLQDYGICIGKAFASQKCSSIFNPKRSVIVSKLFELKKFRFKDEFDHWKKHLLTKHPTYFSLTDEKSSIPIFETSNLSIMTPVNFTKTKNIDRSSNINIIIYLINIFGKFQLPYMAETNYEEKYLPEGLKVVVLGKYKKQIGGVCCQKPIMMGFSKEHLINKINAQIRQLQYFKFFLVFCLAFCTGFLVKQLYNMFLEKQQKKHDPLENIQKVMVKSKVCFNCRQKLSNFILETCGHLNMCKECKQKLKICMECKKAGQKGVQLYAC